MFRPGCSLSGDVQKLGHIFCKQLYQMQTFSQAPTYLLSPELSQESKQIYGVSFSHSQQAQEWCPSLVASYFYLAQQLLAQSELWEPKLSTDTSHRYLSR